MYLPAGIKEYTFGNTIGLDILKNSRINADIQLSCNRGNRLKARTAFAAFDFAANA